MILAHRVAQGGVVRLLPHEQFVVRQVPRTDEALAQIVGMPILAERLHPLAQEGLTRTGAEVRGVQHAVAGLAGRIAILEQHRVVRLEGTIAAAAFVAGLMEDPWLRRLGVGVARVTRQGYVGLFHGHLGAAAGARWRKGGVVADVAGGTVSQGHEGFPGQGHLAADAQEVLYVPDSFQRLCRRVVGPDIAVAAGTDGAEGVRQPVVREIHVVKILQQNTAAGALEAVGVPDVSVHVESVVEHVLATAAAGLAEQAAVLLGRVRLQVVLVEVQHAVVAGLDDFAAGGAREVLRMPALAHRADDLVANGLSAGGTPLREELEILVLRVGEAVSLEVKRVQHHAGRHAAEVVGMPDTATGFHVIGREGVDCLVAAGAGGHELLDADLAEGFEVPVAGGVPRVVVQVCQRLAAVRAAEAGLVPQRVHGDDPDVALVALLTGEGHSVATLAAVVEQVQVGRLRERHTIHDVVCIPEVDDLSRVRAAEAAAVPAVLHGVDKGLSGLEFLEARHAHRVVRLLQQAHAAVGLVPVEHELVDDLLAVVQGAVEAGVGERVLPDLLQGVLDRLGVHALAEGRRHALRLGRRPLCSGCVVFVFRLRIDFVRVYHPLEAAALQVEAEEHHLLDGLDVFLLHDLAGLALLPVAEEAGEPAVLEVAFAEEARQLLLRLLPLGGERTVDAHERAGDLRLVRGLGRVGKLRLETPLDLVEAHALRDQLAVADVERPGGERPQRGHGLGPLLVRVYLDVLDGARLIQLLPLDALLDHRPVADALGVHFFRLSVGDAGHVVHDELAGDRGRPLALAQHARSEAGLADLVRRVANDCGAKGVVHLDTVRDVRKAAPQEADVPASPVGVLQRRDDVEVWVVNLGEHLVRLHHRHVGVADADVGRAENGVVHRGSFVHRDAQGLQRQLLAVALRGKQNRHRVVPEAPAREVWMLGIEHLLVHVVGVGVGGCLGHLEQLVSPGDPPTAPRIVPSPLLVGTRQLVAVCLSRRRSRFRTQVLRTARLVEKSPFLGGGASHRPVDSLHDALVGALVGGRTNLRGLEEAAAEVDHEVAGVSVVALGVRLRRTDIRRDPHGDVPHHESNRVPDADLTIGLPTDVRRHHGDLEAGAHWPMVRLLQIEAARVEGLFHEVLQPGRTAPQHAVAVGRVLVLLVAVGVAALHHAIGGLKGDVSLVVRREDALLVALVRELVVLQQLLIVGTTHEALRLAELHLRAVIAHVDAVIQVAHPEDVIKRMDEVEAFGVRVALQLARHAVADLLKILHPRRQARRARREMRVHDAEAGQAVHREANGRGALVPEDVADTGGLRGGGDVGDAGLEVRPHEDVDVDVPQKRQTKQHKRRLVRKQPRQASWSPRTWALGEVLREQRGPLLPLRVLLEAHDIDVVISRPQPERQAAQVLHILPRSFPAAVVSGAAYLQRLSRRQRQLVYGLVARIETQSGGAQTPGEAVSSPHGGKRDR
eukprot:scaffold1910_cov251-Pinguiococcus_pyrenoidosus.AAC.4